MGKYMKKSKSSPMEVAPKPSIVSLGVKTRAKTLALKRLSTSTSPSDDASSFSYLQLRNRRLQKPPIPPPSRVYNKKETTLSLTPKELTCRENPSSCPNRNPKAAWDDFGDDCLESLGSRACSESGINGDFEKSLELDSRESERGTRESTPCSLVGDSEVIRIPGSTTAKRRLCTSQSAQGDCSMPSTLEIEEFFASAEQEQQRLFIEKYNFDIINDRPLPGRFKWVKVVP